MTYWFRFQVCAASVWSNISWASLLWSSLCSAWVEKTDNMPVRWSRLSHGSSVINQGFNVWWHLTLIPQSRLYLVLIQFSEEEGVHFLWQIDAALLNCSICTSREFNRTLISNQLDIYGGTDLPDLTFNLWKAKVSLLTHVAYAGNPSHIISCSSCFLPERANKFLVAIPLWLQHNPIWFQRWPLPPLNHTPVGLACK